MASVPAGGRHGRRRRDVRHRLPEPVAHADVRHAGEGDGGGYAGVFQHRRTGVHLGLHQSGGRHVAVRHEGSRQDRDPQGDQPDRHDPSHVLRAAGQRGASDPPDRELHRRPQQPPPGAVQRVCRVSARARRGRRHTDPTEQAGGGIARLSAVPLRPGCGRHLLRMRESGRQPVHRPRLDRIQPGLPGRERPAAEDDAAADLRRLRAE